MTAAFMTFALVFVKIYLDFLFVHLSRGCNPEPL